MCPSGCCCLCSASAALHPAASLQMLARECGAEKGTRDRVRSCRPVCDKTVCVGCPKCFLEAGAKQRINPCQMVPLPGNIRALVCLGKLGEWQWIGKEHLYCQSMIPQQGVIICICPFCSRLFPWLHNSAPLLPPIIIFLDLVKPLQWGLLEQTFFLGPSTPFQQCSSTALQTLTESTWEWQTAAVWDWPGREWCPSVRSNKGFQRKDWDGRVWGMSELGSRNQICLSHRDPLIFKIILTCTGLCYMSGGCFDFMNLVFTSIEIAEPLWPWVVCLQLKLQQCFCLCLRIMAPGCWTL